MRTIPIIIVLLLVGCGQPSTTSPKTGGAQKANEVAAAPKRTKDEFRAAFKRACGMSKGTVSKKKFLAEFGPADKSRTFGDDTFWSYNCKDGVIDVHITLLNEPSMAPDALNVTEINDH